MDGDANIQQPSELPQDGVPFVITHAMKGRMADLGYTPEEIRNMTPAQAHEALRSAGLTGGPRSCDGDLRGDVMDGIDAPPLVADRAEIAPFIEALFPYADPDTTVSLRSFYEDEDEVFEIKPVRLGEGGLDHLIDESERLAARCAVEARPVVFCPPVATFINTTASEATLANELALSIECDARPAAARKKLESILGPATLVVASGGKWINPETGEAEDKLHVHYRLKEPTRSREDHLRLKGARRMAAELVGADTSNVPPSHPIRWAGSWHRKSKPRLARIVSLNKAAEIELGEALEKLNEATVAGGGQGNSKNGARAFTSADDRADPFVAAGMGAQRHADPTADLLDVAAALAAIPNADLPWNDWNRVGMATWRATNGTGFAAFDAWSQKAGKYDAAATAARWQHYFTSPPTEIGAGSLFYLAKQVWPGWRKPSDHSWDAARDAGAGERSERHGAADAPGKQPTRVIPLHELGAERFRGEPPPVNWLIEGILPLAVPAMLAAMGDTGKSGIVLDLAYRIATGDPHMISLAPILGGPVVAFGTAVVLTAEDGEDMLHRRIDAVDPKGRRHGFPGRMIVVPLTTTGGPLVLIRAGKHGPETTPEFEALLAQLREFSNLRLVVIDPLQAFVTADLNADPAVGQFVCSQFGRLAAETGATVLACHHMKKTASAITNAAEAREAVRGSTALVDGVRLTYALWPAQDAEAKKVCKSLDEEWRPHMVVKGAAVKANDLADRRLHTFVRGAGGILRDRTCDIAERDAKPDDLSNALVKGVAAAAMAGRPFTRTGMSGLYDQRERLPAGLRAISRARLLAIADQLLDDKRIVKCMAKGSTAVKWLDVPSGPFAAGEGTFALGADLDQEPED
jgi:hypothetical protein